jgi:hypothetical protein
MRSRRFSAASTIWSAFSVIERHRGRAVLKQGTGATVGFRLPAGADTKVL